MSTFPLPFVRMHPEAKEPAKGTPQSAGWDLFVVIDSGFTTLHPGQFARLGTGLCFAIPENTVGKISPRSSVFARGLLIDGRIDPDYRGEVKIQVWNMSREPVKIKHGERLAQLFILPIVAVEWSPVGSLPDTARGKGGFGSTGQFEVQK